MLPPGIATGTTYAIVVANMKRMVADRGRPGPRSMTRPANLIAVATTGADSAARVLGSDRRRTHVSSLRTAGEIPWSDDDPKPLEIFVRNWRRARPMRKAMTVRDDFFVSECAGPGFPLAGASIPSENQPTPRPLKASGIAETIDLGRRVLELADKLGTTTDRRRAPS